MVPELRRRVHFERLNLMDETYPFDRDVDVVFLRNVLIYFEKATRKPSSGGWSGICAPAASSSSAIRNR
jgi:hypothetical protein